MSRRNFASLAALTVALAVVTPASGQPAENAANRAAVPRTAWAVPDLGGVWDFRTLTPLERPAELAGKTVLTEEEAAEFEAVTLERRNNDRRRTGAADVAGAYNDFWLDYGSTVIGTNRTSLVVDPPDGRIPALTPDAERRAAERRVARERPAHGPEDRGVAERCILGFNAGPPMNPSAYNNNVQVFQTPDHVVIYNEMVNDARIVSLDGRPHVPASVRQWRGDSRGHWEGDTLVVETTNFTGQTSFRGSGPNMRLVERFTRLGPQTLLYEYTVDDPESFTRPWSVAVPMKRSDEPIYEYACHEGNYAMPSLLAGARVEDRAAEARARLAGAYRLVSYVTFDDRGVPTTTPYTEGVIMYDPAGRMSVHLRHGDRPAPAGRRLTDAERATLYSSYIAYYGAYSINVDQGFVTHHVEGGLSPGLGDSNQVRYYELSPDGNTLILRVKRDGRVVGEVTWERHQ